MGCPPVVMSEGIMWAVNRFIKWSKDVAEYQSKGMVGHAQRAKWIAYDWLEWCRDMNRNRH
jgi:hypothetical protein